MGKAFVGEYLFRENSYLQESIIPNDGSSFSLDLIDEAKDILFHKDSLSFASNCLFYPLGQSEDALQETKRKKFRLSDFTFLAVKVDKNFEIYEMMIADKCHLECAYVLDKKGDIKVACYRGYRINDNGVELSYREFADEYAIKQEMERLFTPNQKTRIVNLGDYEPPVSSEYNEEDDELIIEVQRPSFEAKSKGNIVNLDEPMAREEDDDDYDLDIKVEKEAFRGNSKKKIANLDEKKVVKKPEYIEEDDEPLNIVVQVPSFEAYKKVLRDLNAEDRKAKARQREEIIKAMAKEEEKRLQREEALKKQFSPESKQPIQNLDSKREAVEEKPLPKQEEASPSIAIKKEDFVPDSKKKVVDLHLEDRKKYLSDREARLAEFMKKEAEKNARDEQGEAKKDNVVSSFSLSEFSEGNQLVKKNKGDVKSRDYFESILPSFIWSYGNPIIGDDVVYSPKKLEEGDGKMKLISSFKIADWDIIMTVNRLNKPYRYVMSFKKDERFLIFLEADTRRLHLKGISTNGLGK